MTRDFARCCFIRVPPRNAYRQGNGHCSAGAPDILFVFATVVNQPCQCGQDRLFAHAGLAARPVIAWQGA
ncbi:hypothetical protein CBM2623_B70093 [Cupriavidus taiwanensis]|nr:hypothetical protein CBM2608_B60093 [Cupriavidus taiwanensis]SPA35551.1 hypothetical protein CBM2623_B70093 [Cupriavidus taiwanensis]